MAKPSPAQLKRSGVQAFMGAGVRREGIRGSGGGHGINGYLQCARVWFCLLICSCSYALFSQLMCVPLFFQHIRFLIVLPLRLVSLTWRTPRLLCVCTVGSTFAAIRLSSVAVSLQLASCLSDHEAMNPMELLRSLVCCVLEHFL